MNKTNSLLAHPPQDIKPARPKLLIYGPPGVGKTWFATAFPAVYFVDTEGGATRPHYAARLRDGNGAYMGPEESANDLRVITDQVKLLATTTHPYKTIVVDSITKPFMTAVSQEAERLGDKNVFGADKKPAISAMRRLVAQIQRLPMNVVFIAHEITEWGLDNNGVRTEIGKAPDVWQKLLYELDLTLLAQKRGNSRVAIVKKSRLEGFPEGECFPLDFAEFAHRYGKEIISDRVTPLAIAKPEVVAEIKRMITLLQISDEQVDRWLDRCNADCLEEITQQQSETLARELSKRLLDQMPKPIHEAVPVAQSTAEQPTRQKGK